MYRARLSIITAIHSVKIVSRVRIVSESYWAENKRNIRRIGRANYYLPKAIAFEAVA
jgi:hypothetical protein